MKEYVVEGNLGRFLGFWYTFKIAVRPTSLPLEEEL